MKEANNGSEPVEVPQGLTNVMFNVWLVSRATTSMLDEALEPSGLSSEEFAIYSVLLPDDGMTPSDLARWMAAPTTTVSSYIKRFERLGHVRRTRNPDDGRSQIIQLTASGKRAHRSAAAYFLPLLNDVETHLGDSVAEVQRALAELHRTIFAVREQ